MKIGSSEVTPENPEGHVPAPLNSCIRGPLRGVCSAPAGSAPDLPVVFRESVGGNWEGESEGEIDGALDREDFALGDAGKFVSSSAILLSGNGG